MWLLYIVLCIPLFLFLSFVGILLYMLSWDKLTAKLLYNTLGRDLRAGYRYLKVQWYCWSCRRRNLTVGDLFQERVKRHPNKICFFFEDQKWTYQQIEDYSNQVANAFTAAGYTKGEEVALFMENRVEFVCIWLGLSKIGVITALINSNLRTQSLAHSVNVIDSKAIIFNGDLASAVRDATPWFTRKSKMEFLCLDAVTENNNADSFDVKSLEYRLSDASKNPPRKTKDSAGNNDIILYVYTSGTTGLPKAAIIRHSRFMLIGYGAKYAINLQENELAYNYLPMYHSSGGIIFTSVPIMFGGQMAIRKKFSASNFWTDVIKYNATITLYIGEICRYLMNQPVKPEETKHNLRLMAGNGLRPQLWADFQKRFRIPRIVEFYGATEGNANVVNMFGKVGAVGFIPRLFQRLYPVNLIKVDPDTGEPIRDETGLCIRCAPGEAGAMVGKILRNNAVNSFDGYANKSATQKKMITNCFNKGDMAFHSGDILVMDEDGYLYFMDRTGDTFRWRGENVSTTEVESILSKCLGLATTCVVYGVEVPGAEGKAGMAAIQSDEIIDLDAFYKGISSALPSFAVPIFLRICKNIESTGTYKLKKVNLQKDGFHPVKISDPIFFLDAKTRSYVRLDESIYSRIISGEARL